jgi:hypothetical protein
MPPQPMVRQAPASRHAATRSAASAAAVLKLRRVMAIAWPVMEHVRWLAHPSLQRPIVIAAFTGWNDAADSASNSVRHLVEAWQAQPLAEIDPEEFTDFATVRPHVPHR